MMSQGSKRELVEAVRLRYTPMSKEGVEKHHYFTLAP